MKKKLELPDKFILFKPVKGTKYDTWENHRYYDIEKRTIQIITYIKYLEERIVKLERGK